MATLTSHDYSNNYFVTLSVEYLDSVENNDNTYTYNFICKLSVEGESYDDPTNYTITIFDQEYNGTFYYYNSSNQNVWTENISYTTSNKDEVINYNFFISTVSGLDNTLTYASASDTFILSDETGDYARTYFVTYYSNNTYNETICDEVVDGEDYTIRENPFNLSGYTFVGWSEDPNGVDDWLGMEGQTIPWTYGDVWLYAIWKPQDGVLHFNQNGTWRKGQTWVNDGGTWKRGIPWVNINGVWKHG